MTVYTLLAELRQRDIRVRAEGDRLLVDAPADTMTPSLREQLRARKPEILRFLQSAHQLTRQHRAIVPLQPHGARPPIFGVPGGNGDVFCFLYLAERLGSDQPLYGLQPPGLDGTSPPLANIEELAAYFVEQITTFYPTGPCVIAGFCAGGMTAFEVGQQMIRRNREVVVALLSAPYPTVYRKTSMAVTQMLERGSRLAGWARRHGQALRARSLGGKWHYLTDRLRHRAFGDSAPAPDPALLLRASVEAATFAGGGRYTPQPHPQRLFLFVPSERWARNRERQLRWVEHSADPQIFFGPEGCTRDNMLHNPYVATLAEQLRECVPPRHDTPAVAV